MLKSPAVLAFGMCLAAVAGDALQSAAASTSRPTIVELLDRYAKQDFEAPGVLAGVSLDESRKVAGELERHGEAWTDARGAREAPARRMVAATFALDVSRIWSIIGSTIPEPRWATSQRLLVWGCAQLKRNLTPLEGERWWHLAAIGLFEAQQNASLVIGGEVPIPPWQTAQLEGPRGHLAHALARFPGEPRLRLARVVAREFSTWPSPAGVDPVRPKTGALPPEITDADVAALTERARPRDASVPSTGTRKRVADELSYITVLRETLPLFDELLTIESIAAEAHLRYGYSLLRLGDRTRGLDHLGRAEALSADPVLLHIARVFAGSAYERMERPAEAIAAYRRAIELAPGARTASLALTSVLMRGSRITEASDVARQFLTQPAAPDPLSRYRTGDHRFVTEYLDRLKRVLQ